MKLYSLTSNLHEEAVASPKEEKFILDIETALGEEFEYCGDNQLALGVEPDEVIYVRTGGTEELFRRAWKPSDRKITLLTSGQSNSLAASMEILSYLRMKGASGQIIHGSAAEIASALKQSSAGSEVTCLQSLSGSGVLEGIRLGVVGRPSDWLISSDVDYAAAKAKLGVELIDISMDEMLEEVSKGGYTLPEGLELNALNTPKYGRKITEEDFRKSLEIYGALKRLIAKYSLNGLTLRCFDMLTAVGNTGCMALAILNSEGITATCEGDVPTMLSMAVCKKVCGTSGFQVNLSRIENGSALFAHCTVPLNIVKSYCYDTHFESGIGVAVHGEFEPGAATIVKIGAGLDKFIAEDVDLRANTYGNNLCRTQVIIRGTGDQPFPLSSYFLTASLGNHHVIIPGSWASAIRAVL